MKMKFRIGQMVHYRTSHGDTENGVVKSYHPTRDNIVFVVYKCDEDWKNYHNYTAAATNISDLKDGWVN